MNARAMNHGSQGSHSLNTRCALVMIVLWGVYLPVLANAETTVLQTLVTPFQDPLQTTPKVIQSGATLPGDASTVQCLTTSDLAVPLGLNEAVDLALCHHARIKSAWAAIKAEAAAVGETRAAYLPSMSATFSHINDQTRYPGSTLNSSTINSDTMYGTMSWRLFDFGTRQANREAANRALAAALADHDAVMQKVLFEVIQAYFDAQASQAVMQAKVDNEVIAGHTLETAKRREAKGAAAHSDTLQATTALAQATLDKSRAQGAYQKALSVLIYAMGVPGYTPLTLSSDLDDHGEQVNKALDDWLTLAQKQHPAIIAAREKLASAQYKVTASRADGLPTVDFTANYYENGRPNQGVTSTHTQEQTLGIAVTIPLFDGFSRTYKIRGAEAQAEQKDAALQDTAHMILMDVVKAHADAASALQNLQASAMLLDAANDALNVSTRKFEKGAADILEILNTQRALSDAKVERIRCLAEWRSARLRLLASVGLMGRTALQR